jgi:HAD superfamily hydrolase (TIGR01509 family)
MITTVIFDLGGVLVRTENKMPRQKLAEKHGMSYQELSDLVYRTKSANLATLGKVSAEDHQQALLKNLNLPLTVLLSNAWDNLRKLLEELWKIDGVFDHIFISAEMGFAKPDPEIYKVVIDSLGQDPAELIFVDDFVENVKAAREARLNAIHFRTREQALADLAEYLDLDN